MPKYQKNIHETALLIERLVAVLLFSGLIIGVALVLRPFVTAILFGGILVIATWPVHEWLLRKGFSNGTAAVILASIAVAFIIVPVGALTPWLSGQLAEAVPRAQKILNDAPELPNWIIHLPLIGPRTERLWSQLIHGEIQEIFTPYSATIRKTIIEIGSALAEGVLQIILSLAIAAMLWLRGDAVRDILRNVASRFAGPFGGEMLNTAAASVKGVAYGVVGTAIIQAIALTFGLFIAGIPGAGALGFLALLIALSQFGILLVVIWGGAAWWLFSIDSQFWAIFIIVWGLIVSLIDNVIRPLLVGFGATMPLTLIFLGVFGGFIAFGFLGMFIGPTFLAVFSALFQAWRQTEKSEEGQ
jgi:predicted PurR-regulated permease PerM